MVQNITLYCTALQCCTALTELTEWKRTSYLAWLGTDETSVTVMELQRSKPDVASSAAALQIAAAVMLADSSEIQGSRLNVEGFKYSM